MVNVSVILILTEISPHLPLDQQVAEPDKIYKSVKSFSEKSLKVLMNKQSSRQALRGHSAGAMPCRGLLNLPYM